MRNKSLKAGHNLVMSIYKYTQHFPAEETNGLARQLRGIAVNIPESIAEGLGRTYENELGLFLSNSLGLVSRLNYLLKLSFQLSYLTEQEYNELEEKVEELRFLLKNSLEKIAA